MRQIGGFDFQHGDFQPRIGSQKLGFELSSVVQSDRNYVAIEHVAERGQDVPFGRDQKAGLVGFQAADSAGAVDFHHFLLSLVDYVGGLGGRGIGTHWRDNARKGTKAERPPRRVNARQKAEIFAESILLLIPNPPSAFANRRR